jgi:NADPH:quinone reductase-like Zn-dependent oxidoreductase
MEVKTAHLWQDRVANIYEGRNETGAFSEYTKLVADLAWKIPRNTTYEEAVTYGVSCMTPAQALFHPDRLGLVAPPKQAPGNPWVSSLIVA